MYSKKKDCLPDVLGQPKGNIMYSCKICQRPILKTGQTGQEYQPQELVLIFNLLWGHNLFFIFLPFAGSADTKSEAVMSELVPEPRQKPVVPMKPVSINSNLLGYIGIDTIIEQMRKKTMKTGFDFNIMVVGRKERLGVGENSSRYFL